MKILASIAWRNLLKRPRRTAIALSAIGVGLFGLIMFQVMLEGFIVMMVRTVVDTSLGHIQVHHQDYRQKQDAELVIPDSHGAQRVLATVPHVSGFSPRVLAKGLVSSAESSTFTTVYGIDPAHERRVTTIAQRVVTGVLPTRDDRRGICLGRALAAKLKVDVGDKVVVLVRDLAGDMSGSALRVRGLFKAQSDSVEKSRVYVSMDAVRSALGLTEGVHEIAIRVDAAEHVDEVRHVIDARLKALGVAVESWQQLAPILQKQIEMSWISTSLMFGIVFVAMAFGIVNAFMMEIFERIHEFGVMMALGTRPLSVFVTLVYEGLFLGLLGSAVGTALAVVVNNMVLRERLDLSSFASGMSYFNLATVVPMHLTSSTVGMCAGGTVAVCILATIYPAVRAGLFRVVEALRHY